MRTRLSAAIAAAALVLSACGGGDGGQQGEVADMMLEAADRDGFTLDEGCVRDVAKKLSDDDASKIVEAGIDGDPELSPDAEAVGEEMLNCIDTDAIVDQIVAEMGDQEGVDADCLKEVLNDQGMAALESGAMFDCISIGG